MSLVGGNLIEETSEKKDSIFLQLTNAIEIEVTIKQPKNKMSGINKLHAKILKDADPFIALIP